MCQILTAMTNIDDFDYKLPDEQIARYPVSPRHNSKLLVFKDGNITDDRYVQLPYYLPADSLLIINNSKVIEARLHFKKATGGQLEIFCLEHGDRYADVTSAMQQKGSVVWICQVGGAKKWKSGAVELAFDYKGTPHVLSAQQLERLDSGFKILFRWSAPELCFAEILHLAGKIPLPPYLNRASEESDKQNYQTVYAKEENAAVLK